MSVSTVGGVDHVLQETVVLVVRTRESRGRFEPMVPDEWDVRTATPGKSVRGLLPRADLVVVTDSALVGGTEEAIAERAGRTDGEPVVGIVDEGEGFPDFTPAKTVRPPLEEDCFRGQLRTLRIRNAYDDAIREYYSLVDCVSAMETNRSPAALEEDPVYERVQAARTAQRDRVEALRDRLLDRGADVAFAPVDAAPAGSDVTGDGGMPDPIRRGPERRR